MCHTSGLSAACDGCPMLQDYYVLMDQEYEVSSVILW